MEAIRERLQRVWVKSCLILMLVVGMGAMQAQATTYYVTTSGNNGNAGTSEGSAWRTITYAATQAHAGDTVYIKAGSYGNEHVVVSYSGSSGSPITFQGYGGTVLLGTLPSPRTTPASTEVGFKMTSKSYITLRNLNFTWYYDCVQINSCSHVTCDNLYIDTCGATGAYGNGIYANYSDYTTITDCTVIDSGGDDVFLAFCDYCTIDGLACIGTLSGSDTYVTDYYCVMRCCSYNLIQNSTADDQANSNKGNHGFAIKDAGYTPYSTYNTVQDCTAYSMEECFSASHYANNNTFLRCTADNSSKATAGYNTCFQVRNAAYDNTFQDCTGTARKVGVGLSNYNEGDTATKSGNQFVNCTVRGINYSGSIAVFYDGTSNTAFENCVFDQFVYFGRWVNSNSSYSMKNSIVYGITNKYDPQNLAYPYGAVAGYDGTTSLASTYNDFYNNGFAAIGSTGILTSDPLFANQASGDYHLQSTAGRWNGSSWVLDANDSPCIDAGDPASSYANEPEDNGDRINIGRYGNTAEASKTPSAASTYTDNRMKESTPTTVYGSNSFLDLGQNVSASSKYRDLVWFDLDPYLDDASTSITNATLSMYWYYPSAARTNATVVDVYKPASGWNHDYVCWTNKTSGTAWTNAGGDWTDANGTSQGTTPFDSVTFPAATVATNQYYDWNVTDLVKGIISSGVNTGMLLKAHTESDNYIAFYGGAAAGNHPKLSITRMASQSEPLAYDNRLKQSTPTTVLGTSTFNDVGTLSGSSYRDLIWFDLSPYDDVQTITKATLSLYWYYPSATRTNDTVVDIYRPASGWNKDYVCWTYKASGTAWTNAGGDWYDANGTAQGTTPFASVTFPAGTIATGQYYEFDVTDLVNYYRSTGTNAGFFIKAHTESDNYIAFYSLNYGTVTMRPKLEITTTIQQ